MRVRTGHPTCSSSLPNCRAFSEGKSFFISGAEPRTYRFQPYKRAVNFGGSHDLLMMRLLANEWPGAALRSLECGKPTPSSFSVHAGGNVTNHYNFFRRLL